MNGKLRLPPRNALCNVIELRKRPQRYMSFTVNCSRSLRRNNRPSVFGHFNFHGFLKLGNSKKTSKTIKNQETSELGNQCSFSWKPGGRVLHHQAQLSPTLICTLQNAVIYLERSLSRFLGTAKTDKANGNWKVFCCFADEGFQDGRTVLILLIMCVEGAETQVYAGTYAGMVHITPEFCSKIYSWKMVWVGQCKVVNGHQYMCIYPVETGPKRHSTCFN